MSDDFVEDRLVEIENLRRAMTTAHGRRRNKLQAEIHHIEFLVGDHVMDRGLDHVRLRDGRALRVEAKFNNSEPVGYTLAFSGS